MYKKSSIIFTKYLPETSTEEVEGLVKSKTSMDWIGKWEVKRQRAKTGHR